LLIGWTDRRRSLSEGSELLQFSLLEQFRRTLI
jgi:hypothetical protein